MRLLTLAFLAAMAASPVLATPEAIFPGLIDVTGVASNDVLNIRAEPNAKAPVVGKLPPNAKGIEVIAVRNNWLRVNAGESSGWINGRFATTQRDLWKKDAVPANLRCMGTEPFWNFSVRNGEVLFSTPSSKATYSNAVVKSRFDWMESPERLISAENFTAVISDNPAICSDGMSDRGYRLDVDVAIRDQGNASWYKGCCMIAQ